jgi:hypothetical protein
MGGGLMRLNIKILILILSLVFFSFSFVTADNYYTIPSLIDGIVILDKTDKPYQVNSNVEVTSSGELIIMEGVTIEISLVNSINVQGIITAKGTILNPVVIKGIGASTDNLLRLISIKMAEGYFEHTHILNGKRGIELDNSVLVIRNGEFKNNNAGIYITDKSSLIDIRNSNFESNNSGIQGLNFNGSIVGNTFKNNNTNGAYLTPSNGNSSFIFNTISGNSNYGLAINQNGHVIIKYNNFRHSRYNVRILNRTSPIDLTNNWWLNLSNLRITTHNSSASIITSPNLPHEVTLSNLNLISVETPSLIYYEGQNIDVDIYVKGNNVYSYSLDLHLDGLSYHDSAIYSLLNGGDPLGPEISDSRLSYIETLSGDEVGQTIGGKAIKLRLIPQRTGLVSVTLNDLTKILNPSSTEIPIGKKSLTLYIKKSPRLAGTMVLQRGSLPQGTLIRLISNEVVMAITPSSDGTYSVPLVPGSYLVEFSAPGHLKEAAVLTIGKDDLLLGKELKFGDINQDGRINLEDLLILASHYGKTTVSPDWQDIIDMDVNEDGIIDLIDIVYAARNWTNN